MPKCGILFVVSCAWLLSLNAEAFGPRRCTPSGEWKTVDHFLPPDSSGDDQEGLPAESASTSKATFVVGSLFRRGIPGSGYRWWVRRSLDRGETWATNDTFTFDWRQDTEANDVTVDIVNDHVYVVGKTLWQTEGIDSHNWVVRKSTDQGATWSTVDIFDYNAGPAGTSAFVASASFGGGALYVAGNLDSFLDPSLQGTLLRKSTDGGATWSTQNLSSMLRQIHSIEAMADGNVFIAGMGYPTRTSPYAGWVVLHSPNGGATWSEVDRFTDGSTILGTAIDAVIGKIAVYGKSVGDTRWTVREARSGSPTAWATIDSWRPEVIDGRGTAFAGAATYANGNFTNPGVLFVSGQYKNPLQDYSTHLTRRRKNAGSKTWNDSDVFPQIYSQGRFTGPYAATTTNQGDILVSFGWANPSGTTSWYTRKLTCR